MWEAIQYVSSGITLAAFVAAVIAWSYKAKVEERERLIRSARPDQRADLVRNALEFFHVDTAGLTREQQYNVAIEQIRARGERFKSLVVLIGFLTMIAATVAVYAIASNNTQRASKSETASPEKSERPVSQPPVPRLQTDNSTLTIPSEDCIASSDCPDIFSVAFSPDGKLLAYADRTGDVRLWSLGSMKETNRLVGPNSPVSSIDFSSSGEKLLSKSSEGVVYVWDVRTGKPEAVLGHSDTRYTQAAWSSTGDAIVLGPLMGQMALWRRGGGIQTNFGSVVKSLAISPDGRFVAAGQFSKNVALISVGTGEESVLPPKAQHNFVSLNFTYSGDKLLSGDEGGVLRAWSTDTKDLLFQAVSPGGGVKDLALSPDGRLFSVISQNGGVWLFDQRGNRLRELSFNNRGGTSPWAGQVGTPWSMAFAPDSKSIAAGSVNGEVVVWEVDTGRVLQYFVGHLQEQVVMVRFSPDGRLLASACFDGTVKVWKIS